MCCRLGGPQGTGFQTCRTSASLIGTLSSCVYLGLPAISILCIGIPVSFEVSLGNKKSQLASRHCKEQRGCKQDNSLHVENLSMSQRENKSCPQHHCMFRQCHMTVHALFHVLLFTGLGQSGVLCQGFYASNSSSTISFNNFRLDVSSVCFTLSFSLNSTSYSF